MIVCGGRGGGGSPWPPPLGKVGADFSQRTLPKILWPAPLSTVLGVIVFALLFLALSLPIFGLGCYFWFGALFLVAGLPIFGFGPSYFWLYFWYFWRCPLGKVGADFSQWGWIGGAPPPLKLSIWMWFYRSGQKVKP